MKKLGYSVRALIIALICVATLPQWVRGAEAEITVDCAKPARAIRALHGVNGGPVTYGGLLNLTAFHKAAGFPLVRLHDCQWPNPSVVDIHTIFRDFRDNADDPASYHFERTDDYLSSVLKTGARIVYRLGESIEHSERKYDVHPPGDYDKWANVCVGIIRHYNQGWANGFHHDIRYWEVWNEPEIRPQMWSGSDEDYYRLYEVTAKRIKERFPELKVGGPGSAHPGDFKDGTFQPTPFIAGFLEHCRKHSIPLDFFSWHRYSDDPQDLARRARGVREMLDREGFRETESHLNEWNYLPRNDWGPSLKGTPEAREAWYEELTGPAGAAFAASALIELQDVPLDAGCFFSADAQGFGMFNPYGKPKKSFFGFQAFQRLRETPHRVEAAGVVAGQLSVCAGLSSDKSAVTILVSNLRSDSDTVRIHARNLPWNGPVHCEVTMLDSDRDWATVQKFDSGAGELTFVQPLKAPALCVIRLTRTPGR